MFAVCVTFVIAKGRMAEFLPPMRQQADVSLATEPGCLQFDICGGPGDEVFLYELYTDSDAFAAHLASDHFKRFDAAVAPLVVEKQVKTYAWRQGGAENNK
ncbi:antibiotic biosynthesis monooxygenase [Thalassococcus sp. CAU 1522]|uniref:Antibiotic biosynthesis monooxygenase n=1 Tax=Thalassococcus arenae TaxID=2851652 RepID=A0ABS6N9D9_9RHOB|nr:antibiotic biosynthesis monooxygenase [Thalassococcus arenae]